MSSVSGMLIGGNFIKNNANRRKSTRLSDMRMLSARREEEALDEVSRLSQISRDLGMLV